MRYVYLVRNLINGKTYVGQTKNFSNRKAGHLYNARKGMCYPLYHSMRKHGVENFKFEILEECDDNIVNEREQHWIANFDSFNPLNGYNLTSGGSNGQKVADSTREKLHMLFSGERNPCFGRTGDKHPMYGKTHTPESLKIMSDKSRAFAESDKNVQKERWKGPSNPSTGKFGVQHHNSKLSLTQVEQIRQRISAGETPKQLALEFGVSRFTIARIRDNKIYT